MCDLHSMWQLTFRPERLCKSHCSRWMCGKIQVAPKQEGVQAESPEALLGISARASPPSGLRSRPAVARSRREEAPKEFLPLVAMSRRWQELDNETTLLRVDSGDQLVEQFASPRDSRPEVASKALLAVECKEHHEKRCSQARRRRTWHRRSRRCRSLSLAKAPKAPKVRLSTPPVPATIVEPPAVQELPQLPSQVAEAYGHELFQSYWDWPLSRLEKKMRLLELDRELMKVEREELAGELQEARRMSWS
mmetsp:Transcript_69168/g.109176  ORF Transcript_69168/g.109176 Transcript_69168/m.109176 type:complete len:250 (+) Transcript_69168:60-809(+)